jgi:uncharacterized protein YcbX
MTLRVANIFRYPVKSLRSESLTAAEVEPIGLKHDRRWLVVDETGQFQTIRKLPEMLQVEALAADDGLSLAHAQAGHIVIPAPAPGSPTQPVTIWKDTVEAVDAGDAAAEFISRALGERLRLVHLSRPDARPIRSAPDRHVSFADAYPLLLTSTASQQDLSQRIGRDVAMLRFRPNVVIEGSAPWAEDTWREIRIGAVRFSISGPCDRCVVTTRDPDTGEQMAHQEPLRTLATFHKAASGGVIFGQNLIPLETGTIHVGDTVEVLRAGPSNLIAAE